MPFQDHNVALGTEGGHVTYPPQDADEALAVALAVQRFGHASAERLISGPGLELIYEALAAAERHAPARRSAADISAAAQADPPDPVARRALASFCAMLGTVAGNLALTLGCVGGLYIGGGIVPKVLPFFRASAFRERFERKGRFTPWLARIPTFVIAAPRTALRGVSAMLEEHLAAAHGAGRLLEEVRTALHRLSASERQVAQDVLSAPRAWLTDPVVQIAERCNVSTPTVLRFCRSMGFKGLADFKLRLGAGLAGSTQVTHMEVQASDPAVERFGKIFNNSISALVGLRDRLRPEAFERAVVELAKARRIEIFGSGSSTVAAEDAQHKLGRLGLAAVARTETQLQSLAATFLSAEDVLLVLSDSGAPDPLNDAVARARKAGATVLAMCPQRSELARLADVLLPVDHPEDAAAMVPMVTRLMQTVIIDVLVTDLALQRRDLISQVARPAGRSAIRRAEFAPALNSRQSGHGSRAASAAPPRRFRVPAPRMPSTAPSQSSFAQHVATFIVFGSFGTTLFTRQPALQAEFQLSASRLGLVPAGARCRRGCRPIRSHAGC